METWKDIPGYEGQYKISNKGNVMSLLFNPDGNLLRNQNNGAGYPQITLKGKKHLVHRLVAIAFIPNPFNFTVVNHINGNPANCNVENLEWCSYSTNQLHAVKTNKKRVGSNNYDATINEKQALEIFKLSFSMQKREIAEMFGVSKSIVYKIAKGEAWNHVTKLPRKRYYKLKAA